MNVPWKKTSLIAALTASLVSCGGDTETVVILRVGFYGSSSIHGGSLQILLSSFPQTSLSIEEAESLIFMRQKEKLAHDVFALSASLWPWQPLFASMRDSEASHAAAIKTLLTRYKLHDPVSDLSTGAFPSSALQAFYDRLAAASRTSAMEALKAGAEIEERDIADLTVHAASINNADILRVYDSLLLGSRNHLRSFVTALTLQGVNYVPQHLSQAEFDRIVHSPIESGR